MANPEHVKHLLMGAKHWNEWRAEQPEGFKPNFFGHEFDPKANFTGAKLEGARFTHARIEGADFTFAKLEGANFSDAKLEGADFRHARTEGAKFWDANLEGADFKFAKLEGARFRGAHGFLPTDCLARNAQFNSPSDVLHRFICWLTQRLDFRKHTRHNGQVDPWSRLRVVYSGPKFLYHLLFLVAFAVPLVLNAATWKAANWGQGALSQVQQLAALELSDATQSSDTAQAELRRRMAKEWAASDLPPEKLAEAQRLAAEALVAAGASTHAELLDRLNDRIGGLQPCLEPHCSPARPMWYVMLGVDRGWRTAFVTALLILYNAGRFLITRAVGDMRENEERTGWTPALGEYGPYWVAHKLMTGLLCVALLGGMMELGLFLLTDFVYLPL